MRKNFWTSDFMVAVCFGLGCLAVVIIILFIAALLQVANPFDKKEYDLEIPSGATSSRVQQILENHKILRRESSFSFAARIFGASKNIQAGKYRFSPSQNLFSILWQLKNGRVIETKQERVKVTFPEGTSIYKMGEILRQSKVSDPDAFQNLVNEGIKEDFRNRHWGIFKYIPSESLEGYLYPDTYWFFKEATVAQLVEIMVDRFEEVVLPFWTKAKNDTGYNLHEILTLASIIEKEAQQPSERAVISSVFYNRLKKGMPLAADPTIKYALERPTKKVYHDQLSVDSPYNTYKRKGLPPGPICNPGIESIKAAVYPAKTNFYFFVARSDGSHIFTRTFTEHQKARIKAAGN